MEITADSPSEGTSAPGRPTKSQRGMLLRIAIPCVVASGALAIAWAGLISGGASTAAACLVTSALAVAGAVLWEFQPIPGRWTLGAVGVAGAAVTGLALVTGDALPWLLVGFWGSMAVLLAALLDFVAGPTMDRSAAIAVVAVATLLLLSALGLGEYVRITWTSGERAILERLPVYHAAMSRSAGIVADEVVMPVGDGQWGETWSNLTSDPAAEFSSMRRALETDGWAVSMPATGKLLADKNGYECEVYQQAKPAAPSAPRAAAPTPTSSSAPGNSSALLQTAPSPSASATAGAPPAAAPPASAMYAVSVEVHVGQTGAESPTQ